MMMIEDTSATAVDNNEYEHNQIKPIADILLLIERLQPKSRLIPNNELIPHTLTHSTTPMCFLLESGYVNICRQNSTLVLSVESAPCIFGFGCVGNQPHDLTLIPLSSTRLHILPLEVAYAVIREEELWQSLVRMLMYVSQRLYEHCIRLSHQSAYETIRRLLLELMEEPQYIRNSTTAIQYILSRCYLSRSGVMNILSELRTGNYITTCNGKLMSAGNLPKKF